MHAKPAPSHAHQLDDGPRNGDFAAYVARLPGAAPVRLPAALTETPDRSPSPHQTSADKAGAAGVASPPAAAAPPAPAAGKPAGKSAPAKATESPDSAPKTEADALIESLDTPADDWERRWQAPFAYVVDHRWALISASFVAYGALAALFGAIQGTLLLLGFELPRKMQTGWGATLLEWLGIDLGLGMALAVGAMLVAAAICAAWVTKEIRQIAAQAPTGIDPKHFVWVVVGLAIVEWIVLRRPGGWGLLFLLLLLTGGASRWLWRITVLLRRAAMRTA